MSNELAFNRYCPTCRTLQQEDKYRCFDCGSVLQDYVNDAPTVLTVEQAKVIVENVLEMTGRLATVALVNALVLQLHRKGLVT